MSNYPSSFFKEVPSSSAKEYFSCCRMNFVSTCVPTIASVLFSNYYALFYNAYYSQCWFLENDIWTFTVIDGVQRQSTVYIFQLKSFECNNVIILQVFSKKSGKFINLAILKRVGGGSKTFFEINKLRSEWGGGDCYSQPKSIYMNENNILLVFYIYLIFTLY